MKKLLARVAKLLAYPLFYLFCLALFGYLSFPYDQLKDRIIAEFDRAQRKAKRRRPGEAPMRLEIKELESYWGSGVKITGARLILPAKPDKKSRKASKAAAALTDQPAAAPKPSVLTLDTVTARVRILPLLVGDVIIDFTAEAFGGEIEGTVPYGDGGDVEVELSAVQLIEVQPLQSLLQGVPLQGVASGTLVLTPKDGKFSKASGRLTITIDGVKLGKVQKDDKGKLQDVVEIQGFKLPSVALGQLIIDATAKDGTLKLNELASTSADFELSGEGKIKLHESWDRSSADIYLKFRFTDAYKSKSDAASSLLGKPGAKFAPAIEIAPKSPFKSAKTEDGFYQFHINGPLSNIGFDPAAKKGVRGARRGKKGAAGRPGGRGFKPLVGPMKKTPKRPVKATPKDEQEEHDKPPAPKRKKPPSTDDEQSGG